MTPRSPSTIFMVCDFVMDPALDEAADTLRGHGHRVVRGPAAIPGRPSVFATEDHDRFFAGSDVMVVSSRAVVDDAVLDAAPRLRGIVFPSIGTESLDLGAATARGLAVANGATPENFESIAEATVLLILAQMYDLKGTERRLRENAPRPKELVARMLQGKTVGFVGFGRIGRSVARRLLPFGVRILFHDRVTEPGEFARVAEAVALERLLAESDVVSLHAAAEKGRPPLLGAEEFRRMKREAYLVNTARGRLVDEEALASALREGRIAGAALDVFLVEPLPPESALRTLPNVILTPHMIGHTQELFASFAPALVENVERILRGQEPLHLCNPAVLSAWRTRLARLEAPVVA